MVSVVREPYGFVHADKSRLKDVYGGPAGQVFVECMRIRPESGASNTVILFSHPIGGGSFLPLVTVLAAAGRHVIYCNPRYRGNDTALILEKCLLDLGACVADLKKRFGYEKVILGGWSGGGSLSMFYQDQATDPTIDETPAGDFVGIREAGFQPADGLLLLAAHISRSVTMTEWIDPSITDESKPFVRDRALNIYDADCPQQPPYSAEFVARFREADEGNMKFFGSSERKDHAMFDLAGYATMRLERAGIRTVEDLKLCTYAEPERFFSYRRMTKLGEADYGRHINAIALAE
jgi:pimeloyl-ACP methyl ester carboxylesterase